MEGFLSARWNVRPDAEKGLRSAPRHEYFSYGSELAKRAVALPLITEPRMNYTRNPRGVALLLAAVLSVAVECFENLPQRALHQQGELLMNSGKTEEAIAVYRQIISEDPSSLIAHANLGLLLVSHRERRAKQAGAAMGMLRNSPELKESVEHFQYALANLPISATLNIRQYAS
eukprot:8891579-Pyramimonas_sp.AAC.1